MKSAIRIGLIALSIGLVTPSLALDWTPEQRSKTYTITGNSGIDLYRAIGENGPKVGITRAIGLTEWDLKWGRDYVPEAGGCRLKAVRPFLVITTTLPKASGLPANLAAKWQSFVSGIAAHEAVHSQFLIDMVNQNISQTLNRKTDIDPDCSKLRGEVANLIQIMFEQYKQTNRDFEQREMANGGTVHQLILDLVN